MSDFSAKFRWFVRQKITLLINHIMIMILRKNGRFIDYLCLPPIIGPTDIDRRVSFPEWPINKVGDRTTIVVGFLRDL